jgi:hypothetical protein
MKKKYSNEIPCWVEKLDDMIKKKVVKPSRIQNEKRYSN